MRDGPCTLLTWAALAAVPRRATLPLRTACSLTAAWSFSCRCLCSCLRLPLPRRIACIFVAAASASAVLASAAAAAAAREPRRATLPLRAACSRMAAWSFSCCARASRVAVAGVAAVAVRLGEGFFAVRTAPFGIGRFGSRPFAGPSSSSGVRGGPVGPRPTF